MLLERHSVARQSDVMIRDLYADIYRSRGQVLNGWVTKKPGCSRILINDARETTSTRQVLLSSFSSGWQRVRFRRSSILQRASLFQCESSELAKEESVLLEYHIPVYVSRMLSFS